MHDECESECERSNDEMMGQMGGYSVYDVYMQLVDYGCPRMEMRMVCLRNLHLATTDCG